MNMNDYVTSNYIKAEDLDDKTVYEFRIADVNEKEFIQKDGEIQKKAIIRLDDGRGVVLNQTRLRILIAAFGSNPANWINRPIRVKKGQTMFQGRPTPAVEVEAIPTDRLGPAMAEPSPNPTPRPPATASARQREKMMAIESGKPSKNDFYDDEVPFGGSDAWEEDRDV